MSRRKSRDTGNIQFDFFRFPVLYGALLGGFIAVLIFPFMPVPTFFAFLIAFSWANAHLMTRLWAEKRAKKRREQVEEEERERRALAARAGASLQNEEASARRRRRRRRPQTS